MQTKRWILVLSSLYLSAAIAGCALPGNSQEAIAEISVTQVRQLAADKPGILAEQALFIDVRTPQEYAQDRIGESPLIPLAEIESGEGIEKIRQLAGDRLVILYCFSGVRSGIAQQILEQAGIETVSLEGGIQAWRKTIPATTEANLF
ncbi:MAG: hypothetical protein J7524_16790 [Roseofilum sp. Belize BBD 4]|uniref:rhodanese-like domain-containing protein n=1 Tax=Roseofilum sp. Belize BBD 4 TaxID=2821500 RepID=UPI001B20190A|nr:rhodanese-like domain-containing protein [Roseofilum sp. Belize BBD 4]MBP0034801.1 hypothetical protein [Roseofilum sp. Belize BBD 4]